MRADKRVGPGRPAFAEGTARTGVFTIRLSDEERAAIVAAAESVGKPVRQWAREALLAVVTSSGLTSDGKSHPSQT